MCRLVSNIQPHTFLSSSTDETFCNMRRLSAAVLRDQAHSTYFVSQIRSIPIRFHADAQCSFSDRHQHRFICKFLPVCVAYANQVPCSSAIGSCLTSEHKVLPPSIPCQFEGHITYNITGRLFPSGEPVKEKDTIIISYYFELIINKVFFGHCERPLVIELIQEYCLPSDRSRKRLLRREAYFTHSPDLLRTKTLEIKKNVAQSLAQPRRRYGICDSDNSLSAGPPSSCISCSIEVIKKISPRSNKLKVFDKRILALWKTFCCLLRNVHARNVANICKRNNKEVVILEKGLTSMQRNLAACVLHLPIVHRPGKIITLFTGRNILASKKRFEKHSCRFQLFSKRYSFPACCTCRRVIRVAADTRNGTLANTARRFHIILFHKQSFFLLVTTWRIAAETGYFSRCGLPSLDYSGESFLKNRHRRCRSTQRKYITRSGFIPRPPILTSAWKMSHLSTTSVSSKLPSRNAIISISNAVLRQHTLLGQTELKGMTARQYQMVKCSTNLRKDGLKLTSLTSRKKFLTGMPMTLVSPSSPHGARPLVDCYLVLHVLRATPQITPALPLGEPWLGLRLLLRIDYSRCYRLHAWSLTTPASRFLLFLVARTDLEVRTGYHAMRNAVSDANSTKSHLLPQTVPEGLQGSRATGIGEMNESHVPHLLLCQKLLVFVPQVCRCSKYRLGAGFLQRNELRAMVISGIQHHTQLLQQQCLGPRLTGGNTPGIRATRVRTRCSKSSPLVKHRKNLTIIRTPPLDKPLAKSGLSLSRLFRRDRTNGLKRITSAKRSHPLGAFERTSRIRTWRRKIEYKFVQEPNLANRKIDYGSPLKSLPQHISAEVDHCREGKTKAELQTPFKIIKFYFYTSASKLTGSLWKETTYKMIYAIPEKALELSLIYLTSANTTKSFISRLVLGRKKYRRTGRRCSCSCPEVSSVGICVSVLLDDVASLAGAVGATSMPKLGCPVTAAFGAGLHEPNGGYRQQTSQGRSISGGFLSVYGSTPRGFNDRQSSLESRRRFNC
eukprot:284816987_5